MVLKPGKTEDKIMILEIYLPLVALSVAMIALGYYWREHSEYALVGFVFLFLLGLILNGQLGGMTYKTGSNMTASISYDGSGNINAINQNVAYHYIPYDDINKFGVYLAIGSAAGFLITLITGLINSRVDLKTNMEEEEIEYD